MDVFPNLSVCRFEDVEPGELFLFEHREGKCVGFAAECNDRGNVEKLILPLGPRLPAGLTGRQLFRDRMAVVSFGREFRLLLPVTGNEWEYDEMHRGDNWLVATKTTSYFLADGFAGDYRRLECFVDISNGQILLNRTNDMFIRPVGMSAYPITWQLVTAEPEPRVIFSQAQT